MKTKQTHIALPRGIQPGLPRLALVAALFASLVAPLGCATGSRHAPSPVAAKAAPAQDASALNELKEMSDVLSGAKTLSFITTSMTPLRSPSGQWVHLFSTARVKLRRPDHLFIRTGGDAFAQRIYFDGRDFSVVAQGSKLYSRARMPGSIDSMLAQASEKAGYTFPFSDVLLADPFASWSRDLKAARYIGQSTRGKEKLQHFAFAAKNVDWELWVDGKSHLPRMAFVKYTGAARSPTVLIEFLHWQLNPRIPASAFAFHAPAGGQRIPLKAPEGSGK